MGVCAFWCPVQHAFHASNICLLFSFSLASTFLWALIISTWSINCFLTGPLSRFWCICLKYYFAYGTVLSNSLQYPLILLNLITYQRNQAGILVSLFHYCEQSLHASLAAQFSFPSTYNSFPHLCSSKFYPFIKTWLKVISCKNLPLVISKISSGFQSL